MLAIRAFSAAIVLLIALTGCAVSRTPGIMRIALLAPFEGEHREIGYQVLYAARLALREASDPTIELVPIDIGDDQAAERARALAGDPRVRVALAVWVDPDPVLTAAFGDLAVLYFPAGDFAASGATPAPDADFIARFQNGDPFAPVPGPLAERVYLSSRIAVDVGQRTRDGSRADVQAAISAACCG